MHSFDDIEAAITFIENDVSRPIPICQILRLLRFLWLLRFDQQESSSPITWSHDYKGKKTEPSSAKKTAPTEVVTKPKSTRFSFLKVGKKSSPIVLKSESPTTPAKVNNENLKKNLNISLDWTIQ